jgi:hypothetical protein
MTIPVADLITIGIAVAAAVYTTVGLIRKDMAAHKPTSAIIADVADEVLDQLSKIHPTATDSGSISSVDSVPDAQQSATDTVEPTPLDALKEQMEDIVETAGQAAKDKMMADLAEFLKSKQNAE